MSPHETSKKLHDMHQQARERWKQSGDGGDLTGEVDGVTVELKYEGSNRNVDYRTVLLDGTHFAREAEFIPRNPFKDINVSYTCFTALSEKSANELIASLKLEDAVGLEEEWYPPDNRPPLYDIHCGTLESVVAFWKAYKPVWTGEKKWGELPEHETV